jgi:hypothetical protein
VEDEAEAVGHEESIGGDAPARVVAVGEVVRHVGADGEHEALVERRRAGVRDNDAAMVIDDRRLVPDVVDFERDDFPVAVDVAAFANLVSEAHADGRHCRTSRFGRRFCRRRAAGGKTYRLVTDWRGSAVVDTSAGTVVETIEPSSGSTIVPALPIGAWGHTASPLEGADRDDADCEQEWEAYSWASSGSDKGSNPLEHGPYSSPPRPWP